MSLLLRVTLAAVLLLISFAGGKAWAQSSSGPLVVELEVLQSRVSGDSPVRLAVTLRNTDAERNVLLRGQPGFGAGGGLVLQVTDSTGRTVAVPAIDDASTADAAVRGQRYVVLKPGTALSVSRTAPARALFRAAGEYRVTVAYRSPMPSSEVVRGEDVEGASAVSAPITVVRML